MICKTTAKQESELIHVRKRTDRGLDLELRSPDAAAEPYLVFALCLAAGMDGIEQNMIRKFTEENKEARGTESLPENPGEAIKAMKKDTLVRETLGTEFATDYMKAKGAEWKGYLEQISEREKR